MISYGYENRGYLRYFYDNISDYNVSPASLSPRKLENYISRREMFDKFLLSINLEPYFIDYGVIHYRDDVDYQNRLILSYVIMNSKIKHKELNSRNKQFL